MTPSPAPDAARTWIEHWPRVVQALSFRQESIVLSAAQANALGRRNDLVLQAFDSSSADDLAEIETAIDAALTRFPMGAFVRLGSRSPKDTPLGVATGCLAASGAQALRLLTNGSRRVAHDLRLALRLALAPHIHLREWRDIPWQAEWRCFMQQGELVGISQYHCRLPLPPRALSRIQQARPALEHLARVLAREMGSSPLVFDICIDDGHDADITLIELNPWGVPTEACLFDWQRPFDGGLRVV